MSTTEIERRPLTPLDIGETKAAQQLYEDGLQQLLDFAEDVTAIRGRGGRVKNHVNRSGVSKITTWCALSTAMAGLEIDRDDTGKALRWRVTVRATAPDGRFSDGVGAFDVSERPSSKAEHDGLGTAFTRARNRAVMDLVGMGEVSAEELVDAPTPEGTALPYGPAADATLTLEAAQAVTQLWPEINGSVMVQAIGNTIGYFPEIAGRTIKGLGWFLSADDTARTAASSEPSASPETGLGGVSGASTQEAPVEVVTPDPGDITTPGVANDPTMATPGVANTDPLGDEVDIDAIFESESQFME